MGSRLHIYCHITQLTMACIVRTPIQLAELGKMPGAYARYVTMSSHGRRDCRTEMMKQSRAWLCTVYLHNVTDNMRAASHERSFYSSFYSSCRLHTAHVTGFCLMQLSLFRVSSQQGTCIFAPARHLYICTKSEGLGVMG